MCVAVRKNVCVLVSLPDTVKEPEFDTVLVDDVDALGESLWETVCVA